MARRRGDGLLGALALTAASALLWGVAHLRSGRRLTGAALLAAHTVLVGLAVTVPFGPRPELLRLAFSPGWLASTAAAGLLLAAVWVGVIARSWSLARPAGLRAPARAAGTCVVLLLCLAVSSPFVFAAHATFLYRGTLLSIFTPSGHADAKDRARPWAGLPRLNVLLLGGDAGRNRFGVRTDSITLASVDTRTGDTVLLSLPRNLERVPMPPGPARERFPDGFTGDGPATPGMLNEVYQYAEDHPEVVPGVPRGSRGPALLRPAVEAALGQPVHYHVLVDMRGFADLIDAMGGIEVTIPQDIAYGRQNEGLLPAGRHRLTGKQALWYGRSRTGSDDYTRMSRQKCLMRAMARQAEPHRFLPRFQQLAAAARRTLSTDVPPSLLPAFFELAEKVKNRGRITSLPFVPPLVTSADPDYDLIRARTEHALWGGDGNGSTSAAAARTTPPTVPTTATATATATATVAAPAPATPTPDPARPVSLDETCPS